MHKEITIKYLYFEDYNSLEKEDVALIQKANATSLDAYAPYSNFQVGVSILLANNKVVLGNNQENIAFPSGLCAERVALFYANANYKEKVKTIVIVSKGDLIPDNQVISPCGSCRQVILESEKRQGTPIKIVLVSQNKSVYVFNSILDLLPFGFGINE
jgi:cytidine deaminase